MRSGDRIYAIRFRAGNLLFQSSARLLVYITVGPVPIVSLPTEGQRRIGSAILINRKELVRYDMALPALMEELVEEILLRLPPDEPAHLIRAAHVCKAWRDILSDGGFRRRYCRFHRALPLLGYIRRPNLYAGGLQFVTAANAAAFSPPPLPGPGGRNSHALDCRHGRVLIYVSSASDSSAAAAPGLIVWDPITGIQEPLSMPPAYDQLNSLSFAGAVLCALHLDGCDHLDCHGGPFLLVFAGTCATVGSAVHATYTWVSVYSSETGAWSAADTSSTDNNHCGYLPKFRPSLLIGGALYFTLASDNVIGILRYNLAADGGHGQRRLSVIDNTPKLFDGDSIPIDINGELGFLEFSPHNCIYTWSWQQQADHAAANGGVEGWVRQNDAVELETLIHTRRRALYWHHPNDTIRFAEGTNIVFISMNNSIDKGVFTLDLKSRQVRKIAETWDTRILPYMNFYTPADLATLKLSPP